MIIGDGSTTLVRRIEGVEGEVFSEEYDPVVKRMLGIFPQAFSHVGHVNSAVLFTKLQAGEDRETQEGRLVRQ